jgi:hypothetical protein
MPPKNLRISCKTIEPNLLLFTVHIISDLNMNVFFINLSKFLPKRTRREKYYFLVRGLNTQSMYSVPDTLYDSGAVEYAHITVLKNRTFVQNDNIIEFFVHVNKKKIKDALTEYSSLEGFDCFGSCLGFDCFKNNISCFSSQEVISDSFFAVGFIHASLECEGIDVVLNKAINLKPCESLVIRVHSFLRDTVLKDYPNYIFLRSRFLRQGVYISHIEYDSYDMLMYVSSKSLNSIDLTNRFFQIVLPRAINHNYAQYFCTKHLEERNKPRKAKKMSSEKIKRDGDEGESVAKRAKALNKGARYLGFDVESVLENFDYIITKSFEEVDKKGKPKAAVETWVDDKKRQPLKDIPLKDKHNLAQSMFKLCKQMTNTLLDILGDDSIDMVADKFHIDGEMIKKSQWKLVPRIQAIYYDGHCCDGKTTVVKESFADIKVEEYDDILRYDDNKVLREHHQLILPMYYCSLFKKLYTLQSKKDDKDAKKTVRLCVDRHVTSHTVFRYLNVIMDNIDEKDINDILKTEREEIRSFFKKQCNFLTLLVNCFAESVDEIISIPDSEPIDSFRDYRAWEKELYGNVDLFEKVKREFLCELLALNPTISSGTFTSWAEDGNLHVKPKIKDFYHL